MVRGVLSVQDGGRVGHQARGVFPSGALDPWAFALANRLAGNPEEAAVLEGIGGGFAARIRHPMTIVLAGSPRPVWFAGVPLAFYQPHRLWAGGVLEVADGPGQHYLVAVSGGWWAPRWWGSRSQALTMAEAGWYRPPRPGEVLLVAVPGQAPPDGAEGLAPQHWPRYPAEPTLRVWPGPDFERLRAREALGVALTVRRFGRMGVVADGPRLYEGGWAMPSRPTVPGVVEVDGAGQYLILGPERQTTGGYPMPFVVDPLDFGLLAELGPGSRFRLSLVAHPQELWEERAARQRLLRSLGAGRGEGQRSPAR